MRSRYGRLQIACSHPFSRPLFGSRTSPYLQEKLALLGCEQVFARVPELVETLLGISVNQAQTYRVCQAISQAIDPHQLHSPSPALAQQLAQPTSLIYGMIDGVCCPPIRAGRRLSWDGYLPPLTICPRLFALLLSALSMWPNGGLITTSPLLSSNYCHLRVRPEKSL